MQRRDHVDFFAGGHGVHALQHDALAVLEPIADHDGALVVARLERRTDRADLGDEEQRDVHLAGRRVPHHLDVDRAGARLDGTPKASRGSTPELKAGTDGSPDLKDPGKPGAPKPDPAKQAPPQIATNTNPNALRIPDLLNQAGKIVQDSIKQGQRGGGGIPGPRTGVPNAPVQENPDFSTEEPTILSVK